MHVNLGVISEMCTYALLKQKLKYVIKFQNQYLYFKQKKMLQNLILKHTNNSKFFYCREKKYVNDEFCKI